MTQAVIFDEETQDFVSELRPSDEGSVSHFVIDLSSRTMLFEERPPLIKRQTFIGNLQAILRQTPDLPLTVDALPDIEDFENWLRSMDRVIRFDASFTRPNPAWRDRTQRVRDFLEGTGAQSAHVDASVDEKSGSELHVQGTLLEEITEHVRGGYGRIVATAIASGRRRIFRSDQHIESTQIKESSDDESDSIFAKIVDALMSFL